jgi:hypothetical protein
VSRVNHLWKRWIDSHPLLLNHIDFTRVPTDMSSTLLIPIIKRASQRVHSMTTRDWTYSSVDPLVKILAEQVTPLLTRINMMTHIKQPYLTMAMFREKKDVRIYTTCSCSFHAPLFLYNYVTQLTQLICNGISHGGHCSLCSSDGVIIKTCSTCPRTYCSRCMTSNFLPCHMCGRCINDRCIQCTSDIRSTGKVVICGYHAATQSCIRTHQKQ